MSLRARKAEIFRDLLVTVVSVLAIDLDMLIRKDFIDDQFLHIKKKHSVV